MDCEHIREQLSALIDGQLDADTRRTVETHLANCPACDAERRALVALNSVLVGALSAERQRAGSVAARAIERFHADPSRSTRGDDLRPPASLNSRQPQTISQRRPKLPRFVGYLLAAAAGFVLAAGLFSARKERPVGNPPDVPLANAPAEAVPMAVLPVAQVVRATGPLSFRPANTAAWEAVPDDRTADFRCPVDTQLRTDAATLCELCTPDGGRIRLSEQTEIAFRAPDEVELVTGQLWCKASERDALRVIADGRAQQSAMFRCAVSAEGLAIASDTGALRVMAAAGTVDVTVRDAQHRLTSGAVCSINDNDVTVRQSPEELLIATRWMQPLLTLEGHDNPELTSRVDALLARVGRAKISYLFEQDLRGLGEFGALPLLRFVESADPARDREQRQSAMRILTDTAPVWMTPELIALLDDSDGIVRAAAARTLARLTNQTQGLSVEDWQSDEAKRQAGVAAWREWWVTHSVTCSPPPPGVRLRSPPRFDLKARN